MNNPRFEHSAWWHDLRYLAVGWTILPLALMLVIAVGATAVVMQATVKRIAEDNSQSQAQLAAKLLASQLQQYALAFQVLAEQPDLSSLEPELAQQHFTHRAAILDSFPAGSTFLLLDLQGRVITVYPPRPGLIGQQHRRQPYLQGLNPNATTPTFFDITPEPATDRLRVGLSVPVVDEVGTLVGVLAGQFYLNASPFAQIIASTQPAASGQTYLVDRRGLVIAHTDPAQIGQDFSQEMPVASFRQTGVPGSYTYRTTEGAREVVAFAPVDGVGWGVMLKQPWSQVVQPVQQAIWIIGAAFFLGLSGLVLVVFWSVQRISQPLEQLVVQAKEVAAGNYEVEVASSQIAEIRELGVAFNHMVNQLTSYRAGLQEYVAAITDTQEEERRRVARDLHDGTVQSLIAIGQRIELARESLGELSTAESKTQLNELRNMVTETIASVRQFSRDLRPLALEDLGLLPALHFLVNRLSQEEDIATRLDIEGDAIGLSPDLETAVYRLIQEALNNIRKHAQATEVRVLIRFLARQTILEVHDNGVGFEVPQATTDLARNGSFGLLGMEERAQLFGGDISLQSALNQGSIVKVILPHEQVPRRRAERAEEA